MADTDVLSLAEAKTAINMDLTTTEHDDEIAEQVTAISDIIDDWCGPVVQRTVTAEVHTTDGSPVVLRNSPIASVGTVRQALQGDITTLSECGFGGTIDGYYPEQWWHADAGTLLSGVLHRRYTGYPGDWPRGAMVEVTYTAGRYANTAAVDAKFKNCARAILRRLWKRESGTWAQSSTFFEDIDPALAGTSAGFYRVAEPIIKEMLRSDRRLPGAG